MIRGRHRLVRLVFASCLSLFGLAARRSSASADSPRSDAAAAQIFFERGREAMARDDVVAACQYFDESLRLERAAGTLFNLSECEERRGLFASAWQHLREGIDLLDERDPRRAPAETSARELLLRAPRLTVELADASKRASGVRVFRDGVELSSVSLAEALPIDPGRHTVVVRARGRVDVLHEVSLAAGETKTLQVSIGEPEPEIERPIAPQRRETAEVWLSAAPFASFGVGPGVMPGGRLGVHLVKPPMGVGIEASFEATPGDVAVAAERLTLWIVTGAVVGCLHFGSFRPCAIGRIGRVHGEATTVDAPLSSSSWTASAGARAEYEFPLGRRVHLVPAVDLVATLVRARFEVDRAALWTAPPLSGAFALAVRARGF